MNKSIILTFALCCATLCLTAPSFSQSRGIETQRIAGHFYRDDGKEITAQQKAESDQLMQAGLQDLQQAASSLQAVNGQAAYSELQSASSTMTQAEPIYHGFRERSIKSADNAVKVLGENRRKSVERASAIVERSITDAQTAVASW